MTSPRRFPARIALRRFALCVALLAPGLARALEFRSVAEDVAVLYDGPSKAAKPVWLVSRDYPLELIVHLDPWIKVRDHAGNLSWVEKRFLSERRTVLVTAASADVRQRPEDLAPVVFSAAQNVVLELVEGAQGGWLRVRHADGAAGYVRAGLVWGD